MSTITVQLQLKSTICCECGIVFGMEELYRKRKIDSGESFYCPSGHGQYFTESTVDKLKKQLASREEDIRYLRMAKLNEKRSHAATKGHLTRVKKRVGNGICPCCNRHFTDLERHMNTKHPEYKE